MTIILNNSPKEIAERATLESIVAAELGSKRNGVAVAVNNTVIPKTQHDSYIVQPNDTILIIKATQGG
ncbi:sulfur carrier protein ThiS [Filimonas effusa]|uniref:Sulfur carrier protein ThiS n=1 Tax=Filimonas effusa TaxID=2508721 RepID=A0A4Q1D194_9BACT|nr:sulfur carrier protein ThiS [Filimonas effusa]RXK80765.1 sulfur carrier protein ThiS [Filimonas effusa]